MWSCFITQYLKKMPIKVSYLFTAHSAVQGETDTVELPGVRQLPTENTFKRFYSLAI